MSVRKVPDPDKWIGGTLTSAGLHTGIIAIVLIGLPHLTKPPTAAPAAMVFELAQEPASPEASPQEVPPGPEQQEAERQTAQLRPEQSPIPEAPKAPNPELLLSRPKKALDEAKTDAVPDERDIAVATTAPPAAPPKDSPAGAPSLGRPAPAPADAAQGWEAKVLGVLERNKRYPRLARNARQEDVVYVCIRMDRTGNVQDARVCRSKGITSLDNEVVDLARRSSPLPAPPKDIAGDTINITVPVEFFLQRRP